MHIPGPSFNNTTKIPREGTQTTKKAKMGAGEGKNKRETLGLPPFAPHPFRPPPSGPRPSGFPPFGLAVPPFGAGDPRRPPPPESPRSPETQEPPRRPPLSPPSSRDPSPVTPSRRIGAGGERERGLRHSTSLPNSPPPSTLKPPSLRRMLDFGQFDFGQLSEVEIGRSRASSKGERGFNGPCNVHVWRAQNVDISGCKPSKTPPKFNEKTPKREKKE